MQVFYTIRHNIRQFFFPITDHRNLPKTHNGTLQNIKHIRYND